MKVLGVWSVGMFVFVWCVGEVYRFIFEAGPGSGSRWSYDSPHFADRLDNLDT